MKGMQDALPRLVTRNPLCFYGFLISDSTDSLVEAFFCAHLSVFYGLIERFQSIPRKTFDLNRLGIYDGG